MKIALRANVPAEVTVVIDASRPLPLSWTAWRDGFTGGAPVREGFTTPEGWPISIADAPGSVHAFYLVFDRAVHAVAMMREGASPDVRTAVIGMFATAQPLWDDAIVALADL